MLRVRGILWDEAAESHIWVLRHRVRPGEVEAAAYEAGRYLLVVVRLSGDGFACVITARDMTATERRRYRRHTAH